jgi:RNA polymerase sigma-70 factor (ECF subfamily)
MPDLPAPGPAQRDDDRRAVAALLAGDEAAFLALVKRYHGAMLRVAALHVRSRASAEEVVQEAWLGVLKGLERFEGRSTLKGWIFSILVNCARSRGARDGRTVPLSALGDADDEGGPAVPAQRFLEDGERWAGHWAAAPAPWPDERAETGELVALVREALETLPESQRTVMTLRDVDGWEAEAVCELLGVSEGNQRVLLHRARSKVRAHVEARMAGGRP